MRFYADDVKVGDITKALRDVGVSVLQTHLLAPTEREHVAALVQFFDPIYGSLILDLGAGTGAVADMMLAQRPDLRFILLNQSQAQLDIASDAHVKVHGDFQDIPRIAMRPNAVMMTYALGHGDLRKTLSEVARVLPHGGTFMLYDLTSRNLALALQTELEYSAYPARRIIRIADEHGLALNKAEAPRDLFSDHMLKLMSQEQYDEIFDGVVPMLFRFGKL
jgi:ubiquinone/menaquinone biosynthesis C-methylase UbiE